MSMLSFAQPMVLMGLLALPVIWWLLRLTPPKPRSEVFPPLRILLQVLKKQETPHQSPWWLTLLRLLMAGLIVLALAEPVFNPRDRLATGNGLVAIVIDNGWASAAEWDERIRAAEQLIDDAEANGAPVVLALTAEKPNVDIGPFDTEEARNRLRAAAPRPLPVERAPIHARVAEVLARSPGATVAVLGDGLAGDSDDDAFSTLLANAGQLLWFAPQRLRAVGITSVDNRPDQFAATVIRSTADNAPRQVTAGAFDDQGRRIADAVATFAPGQAEATAEFRVPFELRNDFAVIRIDGEDQAAAVRLLDENARRRRIGLLSQAEADQAQPLLSPLYYIRRALEPFADIVEPDTPDLAEAVPQLLEQRPAIIVMADIGTLPDSARGPLIEWLHGGGMLVRFAGSRLAAAGNDEELLPVLLRIGERSLGGALSWTEPQAVAEFPPSGPFSDLSPPRDVSVSRQILAEPTSDLFGKTWAVLADGTPLVTADSRGNGTVVLFHVTPEATWSNLPISGSFVEMLRRIVQMSRNQGAIEAEGVGKGGSLAPFTMVAANGTLVPPAPDVRPLAAGSRAVTVENPPGLYGTEEGYVAHNLLAQDAVLRPLARPQAGIPVAEASYAIEQSLSLKGPFIAAALTLLALDTLAVFWMGGMFVRRQVPRRPVAPVWLIAALSGALLFGASGEARAQDIPVDDAQAVAAISTTRIAFVLTGDASIDAVSRAGIAGLSRFLAEKTALEPGPPAGVDIARDELAFYPIIYWPIDAAAAMPTEASIARIDAYMKQGGTVLFDTRDQFSGDLSLSGSASQATQRLRDILDHLNVPPLEPVPEDHVLTKAFYILQSFPGRYSGSPLWVEASLSASNEENRPVRTGDGVSPIMITANDLAGAWAIDTNGDPLLPTVPSDPMQRVYAYRAGVNIMMYMLTGNYKSDQVHVPVLLERLGQ